MGDDKRRLSMVLGDRVCPPVLAAGYVSEPAGPGGQRRTGISQLSELMALLCTWFWHRGHTNGGRSAAQACGECQRGADELRRGLALACLVRGPPRMQAGHDAGDGRQILETEVFLGVSC